MLRFSIEGMRSLIEITNEARNRILWNQGADLTVIEVFRSTSQALRLGGKNIPKLKKAFNMPNSLAGIPNKSTDVETHHLEREEIIKFDIPGGLNRTWQEALKILRKVYSPLPVEHDKESGAYIVDFIKKRPNPPKPN